MKTSTERILTTHVGSLPRPQDVVDCLFAEDRGEPVDPPKYDAALRRAVADVVARQAKAGVDIVSDGEMGKISYATYIRHRLTGFEGDSPRPTPQDLDDFPEFRERLRQLAVDGFAPVGTDHDAELEFRHDCLPSDLGLSYVLIPRLDR